MPFAKASGNPAISMLNRLIEVLNLLKEVASSTPADVVFGSVVVILATVEVSRFPALCCIGYKLKCA